jgi:hypothetical protein
VLRAEDLLDCGQQCGEQVAGGGWVFRPPGPAGEVVPGGQGSGVLGARHLLDCGQQRGEQVAGGGRVFRLPTRAAGLVCLGAGAGLIRGDLRQIRGTDVIARSGGVIVAVRGARPRTVPVLARYHAPLLAAAASAGTGLVTGGAETARKNVTARLNASLAGGGGLPRLDTSRLRATWLRDVADLVGLATFLHAAGISCSQRLGDLVAGLEPAGEAGAVRLLGGPGRR